MKQKGFTLIELLVVIAIIGILAMVVFINVNSSRSKARDAKRIATMHDVQNAFELYDNDCGQYPATWDVTESTGCTPPMTLADFITVLPTDPSTGNDYVYSYDSNANTYTVTFSLENAVDNLSAGTHTLTPDGFN